MTTCPPPDLLPIPGFPAYASSPDGLDVWRVVPAKRGRTAGKPHRMRPTKHPRGLDWAYQLTDAEGKLKRMSVPRLVQILVDSRSGVCEACADE